MMKTLLSLFFVFAALFSLTGQIQINDCQYAQVICSSENLEFNPIGPGFNDYADPDNDEGCITALEQNSAWYYFQIDPMAPPGLVLGFIIHPNGGFGEDYDWALYGPNVNCGELGSPIRCSSSSFMCDFCPETGMGMGTVDVTEGPGSGDGFVMTLVVEPGQGFYLMIDNWLGTTNGFVLEWTDSAADYLNCEAMPPCALDAIAGNNILACEGDTEVQLNGSVTGGQGMETFQWVGDNGGTDFLDDPTLSNPTVTIPVGFTGMIVYTLTVMEDTCTDTDEVTLFVNPLPNVSINPVGPFCPTSPPVQLMGTPPFGIWSGDVFGSIFNPILEGPGTHTVNYSFTDNNNCTAVATLDIVVHEAPEISVDPDPAEFCTSDAPLILTASAEGGAGNYMFHWSTPTGIGDENTYAAVLGGPHNVTVTDANNCTDAAVVNVVEHLNPEPEINDPNPVCASVAFMTLSATPPGGLWEGEWVSPGGDLIPLEIPPGTYPITYTYTDQHNCVGYADLDLLVIPEPLAFATSNSPVCAGEQIMLMGTTDGMGSLITYQWTGPNGYASNQQNPTDADTEGEYVLQVTVDDCPSELVSVFVNVIDLPEANATNGGPYCNGETIALFGSVNESGNIITYNWTGPNGYTADVQNPLTAVAPGTYTLVVSVDGCISAPVTTEVVFSTAPDASASNTGPYCAGESISLMGNTMSSGTVISYQWTGPNGYSSNAQSPGDATQSGPYQLVVTVDGCQSNPVSTTVMVHPLPQPSISGQNSFCTGFSTTLDAGAGYVSYLWDDNSGLRMREVSTGGTYSVTVTDVNGCSSATSIVVTENSSLTPVITGDLEFCEGENTTLDAGPGFTEYEWSDGQFGQTVVIQQGGNVGVIVTDAAGCTGSTSVITIEHQNPDVVIGGSTTYCIGGFTTLDAGTYQSYVWNNDSTTQTIIATSPGTYAVSVTDSNGCTGTASVNVNESTSLSPVITGLPAFCENGSTILNAGSGFATYLWSDNSTNQTLEVSVSGTYSVTVSDGQSCTGEADVFVSEILPPVVNLLDGDTLCNTSAGGSVIDLFDLIVSGDPSGSWMDADNSGASGFFNNLNFASVPAGDYRFIYTTNSATVPCPETMAEVVITVLDCTCPEVSVEIPDPLCNAGATLDLSGVLITGESGTWSIIQSPPGANPATVNGNVFNGTSANPGIYTLEFALEDAPPPGCPLDYTVMIELSAAVSAGQAAAPVELCAGEDQLIDLDALISGADAGGSWTETSVTPSQGGAFNAVNGTFRTPNQGAGTYHFTYTLLANGGCPGDATEVEVIISPVPEVMIQDDVIIDCANPVRSLDATNSSSGAEYVLMWSGPGILADGNENTLTPNIDQAGNYTLTITHAQSGCFATASVNVTANTDPPAGAVINSDDPACFGDVNGYIQVATVLGGSAPYMYSMNGITGSQASFTNLDAGTYALEIIDANGCKWDTVMVLIAPTEVTIDIGPDLDLDLGISGAVTATINVPLSEIDTILWNPSAIVECMSAGCLEVLLHPLNSTSLVATVTDINGCTDSDMLQLTVTKDRDIYIPNVFSPNHDGSNDVFRIEANAVKVTEIRTFTIFDRWGGIVHEATHFQPDDPSGAWDGRFKEEAMNPGVFTYAAQIEFIDGEVKWYAGDVTLVK